MVVQFHIPSSQISSVQATVAFYVPDSLEIIANDSRVILALFHLHVSNLTHDQISTIMLKYLPFDFAFQFELCAFKSAAKRDDAVDIIGAALEQ